MKKNSTSGLKTISMVVIFSALNLVSESQVPQGFNYQAVARDNAGNAITNATLGYVKLSVLSDTNGFKATGAGVYVWEERHNNVKTNAFGMFTLTLGNPLATKVQGSATTFSAINWASGGSLYVGTKVYYQTSERIMGSAKLWSVPYSMISGGLGGSLKKLAVTGETTSMEEALFEVKNRTGQTVFAVFNEGIRAYVDDGDAKGTKGGFAIGGFGTAKAQSQPLFVISPDSARIYVDETNAKASKGGFAIGGFTPAKGITSEFMYMTPDNYFIGHSSGRKISTGTYNSTFGYQSGQALTTGFNNVFVGYQSGYSTDIGNSNIFIGSSSGYSNTSGYWNIMLGRATGQFNTTGFANIIIGDYSGNKNTVGTNNVMVGDYAGGNNTTGSENVFVGASAGLNNVTGSRNMYIGYHAGMSGASASGSNNIFMGAEAGLSNTTGFDNIAIGNLAGRSNVDGTYNVMIGPSAGRLNVSGDYNTMLGYKAGENQVGDYATLIGYNAGNSTTSGNSQTMLGYEAGRYNTGSFNTFLGVLAGGSSGAGTFNTYVGLAAGREATGSNNIFIGRWAGWYETGSGKLIIETNYSAADNFNNALLYGDFVNRYLRINGQLFTAVNKPSGWAADIKNSGGLAGSYGLNITAGTPTGTGQFNYMIDFNTGNGTWEGSILINNGTVEFYQASDARLKENISQSNLDAVTMLKSLKVVDYNFKKSPGAKHTGYIAQDVQKVFPGMVIYDERNDTWAIAPASLIPVLHKAIQEQQSLIDAQARKIAELEAAVNLLMNK